MELEERPETAVQIFGRLYREKKRLEADIAAVKERMGQIEATALQELQDMGADQMRLEVEGPLTVYIKEEVWATVVEGREKADAVAELKQDEQTAVFVHETFNSQSLSAFLREALSNEQPMPYAFRPGGTLEPIVKTSLQARAGTVKSSGSSAAAKALRRSQGN